MDTQGTLQGAFAGDGTRPNPYRLRFNFLNPSANPPAAGGVSRRELQGIWAAVYEPATGTIRASIV